MNGGQVDEAAVQYNTQTEYHEDVGDRREIRDNPQITYAKIRCQKDGDEQFVYLDPPVDVRILFDDLANRGIKIKICIYK